MGDPRRYPLDWVFCSRRCQDAFHLMYGNWERVQKGYLDKTEVAMINPSDVERAAMRQCLKAFGGVAGEIGFDKPLGDYSASAGPIPSGHIPEQLEHDPQVPHVNGRRRGRHDGGLGAEGHPQARRGDHPQVVGVVAHHHGPLQRHAVGARLRDRKSVV